MFGGNSGFGTSSLFGGGLQEIGSDFLINRFVPGGLNGKHHKEIYL